MTLVSRVFIRLGRLDIAEAENPVATWMPRADAANLLSVPGRLSNTFLCFFPFIFFCPNLWSCRALHVDAMVYGMSA